MEPQTPPDPKHNFPGSEVKHAEIHSPVCVVIGETRGTARKRGQGFGTVAGDAERKWINQINDCHFMAITSCLIAMYSSFVDHEMAIN